jgi:protein SCO1/2
MIAERTKRVLCLLLACALISACGGGGGTAGAVGGPFKLTDQNGQARTEQLLKGKWTAVFFGYTFCPDVCPTTLQSLADAQGRLGPRGKDLQVVFITVDPARDTPRQLRTYLSSQAFPKGTIGLTGTPDQVAAAAKAYKVFYQKEGSGQDYGMQHSSAVYLMDPRGRFNEVLAYDLGPAELARQISQAMAG